MRRQRDLTRLALPLMAGTAERRRPAIVHGTADGYNARRRTLGEAAVVVGRCRLAAL